MNSLSKTPLRVGIFGGSFNPLHFGHIHAMLSVKEALGLNFIEVIPSYHSPLKHFIKRPLPIERLEMLQIGLKDYSEVLRVNDWELKRSKKSYTFETVKELQEKQRETIFFLIIGYDQWENLSQWKDYKNLLTSVHFVVVNRLGVRSFFEEKMIEKNNLGDLIKKFEPLKIHLKNGKKIFFIHLKNIKNLKTLSSSFIRKKIKEKEPIKDFIPPLLEKYIKAKALYL